jgi:hypothetical protein
MNRQDVTIVGLGCALLALALFRTLVPQTSPPRRISVEAVDIKAQPIKNGESVIHEASWTPKDDVFIVGWAPTLGSPGAQPGLYLMAGPTAIFAAERGALEGLRATFLPSGTGYRVSKGEVVKLRLQITNTGQDGDTGGASALIYFHPAAWR